MRHPTKIASLEAIKNLNIPVETVFDCGVLNGTPELAKAFPDKLHILFEPIVEWNEKIHENYSRIKHELFNFALSDMDGEVTLQLSTIYPDCPITHARITNDVVAGSPGPGRRIVPSMTLDTFFSRHQYGYPCLLKIDVDGAELLILSGAKRFLEKCNVIIIEAGLDNFVERSRAIESAGFALFDIVDLAYYNDLLAQFDLVFVRSDILAEKRYQINRGGFDAAKWVNYQPS